MATEAASGAIDIATDRQFGQLSSSEFRWYKAKFYQGRYVVDIHDLMTTASLMVETVDETGTPVDEITKFLLTLRTPYR